MEELEKDPGEEKEGKDKKGKKEELKRINIGAHTTMITPFVALSATAIVSIYTYFLDISLVKWLILFFSTLVVFLFIGSLLQVLVEHYVNRYIEEEEARLRLLQPEEEEGMEILGEGEEIPEGVPEGETEM